MGNWNCFRKIKRGPAAGEITNPGDAQAPNMQVLQKSLQRIQLQLATCHQQLAILNQQLAKAEGYCTLPPLEEGQIRVFRLKYLLRRKRPKRSSPCLCSNAASGYRRPHEHTYRIRKAERDRYDSERCLKISTRTPRRKRTRTRTSLPCQRLRRPLVGLAPSLLARRRRAGDGRSIATRISPRKRAQSVSETGSGAPCLVTQSVTSLSVGESPSSPAMCQPRLKDSSLQSAATAT